ncbi:MAG: hypothetical protein K2O04_01830 [Clostridiales bacterium]|nr:hypothetical protein [Clostridiales bacterium]
MITAIEEKKDNATQKATVLYELLNIKQDGFIKEDEVGMMHEKQMQALYNDFKNSCYNN